MTSNSPSRRAALLRLLDDWEAGKMTPLLVRRQDPGLWDAIDTMFNAGLVAFNGASGRAGYTLTPAGLAAARREKDATT